MSYRKTGQTRSPRFRIRQDLSGGHVTQTLYLVSKGRSVHLYDLDQTKPLFRSRDAREKLERLGVVIRWEDQLMDAPVITGGVRESLQNGSICSILDIGGFETGARMIGRFQPSWNRPDRKPFIWSILTVHGQRMRRIS